MAVFRWWRAATAPVPVVGDRLKGSTELGLAKSPGLFPSGAVSFMSAALRPPAEGSLASILVIDDDPALLKTIEGLLKSLGHSSVTAGSGREGLARLKEATVDVVLVDIVMRDLNGLELMREATASGSKAKFIAMSGGQLSVDNDWLQEALRHGAIQALPKPFGSLELSLAIRNALASRPTGR